MVSLEQVVFWVAVPCNEVVTYQCFGRPCCLHLSWKWRYPI